jgi:signal peptidase I
MGSSSTGQRLRTLLREHAESLLLAFALALLVRWLVLSAYVIRSDAMAPTFQKGDIVLGLKTPFDLAGTHSRQPERGELVIFKCPDSDGMCLRRIVGLPGDRVEMIRQRLWLNGESCRYQAAEGSNLAVLKETCLGHSRWVGIEPGWTSESWGPTICPPLHVFVLNDFRPDGADSRRWGVLPYENLVANAVAIWISFDWSASNRWPLVRWQRTFLSVN